MESFYKKYENDLMIFDEYGEEFSWDDYKKKIRERRGGLACKIAKWKTGGMRIVFALYRQIAKRIRNKSNMLDILRIGEYN